MIAKEARPRRVRWLDMVIWLVCIAALAAMGWAYYLGRSGLTPDMVRGWLLPDPVPPFADHKSVDILLIGVDDKIERGRADTLILGTINFETKRLGLLSVPRDARVRIPGHGINKINAAYSLGGPDLCAETVSGLLGVPLEYYIKTDFKGIEKIVDAMGGVVIDVEKNMDYEDKWGNLYIHLRKGRQRLKGYDAMCYVRFRHDVDGDYGRMRRQKQFLLAAYRQMVTGEAGAKKPDLLLLARQFTRAVKTNLSDRQIVWLTKFAKKVEPASALVAAVPSKPERIQGVAYETVDEVEARQIAAEVQRRLSVAPEYDYKFARVEVQNAAGEPRLNAVVASVIRDAGYRVTNGEPRKGGFPLTKIFFAPGYRRAAEEIAAALGTTRYYPRPATPRSDAPEVTIILGADARTLLTEGRMLAGERETVTASDRRRF